MVRFPLISADIEQLIDMKRLEGHSAAVRAVDWSKMYKFVYTAGDDCLIKVRRGGLAVGVGAASRLQPRRCIACLPHVCVITVRRGGLDTKEQLHACSCVDALHVAPSAASAPAVLPALQPLFIHYRRIDQHTSRFARH